MATPPPLLRWPPGRSLAGDGVLPSRGQVAVFLQRVLDNLRDYSGRIKSPPRSGRPLGNPRRRTPWRSMVKMDVVMRNHRHLEREPGLKTQRGRHWKRWRGCPQRERKDQAEFRIFHWRPRFGHREPAMGYTKARSTQSTLGQDRHAVPPWRARRLQIQRQSPTTLLKTCSQAAPILMSINCTDSIFDVCRPK